MWACMAVASHSILRGPPVVMAHSSLYYVLCFLVFILKLQLLHTCEMGVQLLSNRSDWLQCN
jgi:hypothetical protein